MPALQGTADRCKLNPVHNQEAVMPTAVTIRTSLIAAAILTMSACATPQQHCIAGAQAEVRFLEEELTERRVNIARGYAIHRTPRTEMLPEFCYSPLTGMRFMCMDPVQTVRETRRPINVADEQERIAQLERALARERERAAQAVSQCRAQFPED